MSLFDTPSYPSLPGTQPAPRGLFIDLWGTLLVDPPEGEKKSASDLQFHEGALEALFLAHRSDWLIYLIGNENEVAHGQISDDEWNDLNTELCSQISGEGIRVQRQYICLDHPEGVGAHAFDSVFQLPNTGLLYHAMHNDSIELKKSWVIGDSTVELVSGWRAGCKIAGVRTGLGLQDGEFEVTPNFMADNLQLAVLGVLGKQPVELQ